MREGPIAYLITFRTYGSWLHGDERGSFAFRRNAYGTPGVPSSAPLRELSARFMKGTPQSLDAGRRKVVAAAINSVCDHREWYLHAVAVRTEHIHAVVSSTEPPEKVLASLKAWATRRVRDAGLSPKEQRLWSHHGSTVYLWDETQLERATLYVVEGQGAPLDDHPR